MAGAGSTTTGHVQWLDLTDGPVYSVLHTPDADAPVEQTAVLIVPPFGWDELTSHRARRFWAIQLARGGYPTLRIDLPGTAESHGEALDPDLVPQWVSAVDEAGRWLLARAGVRRLAVIGIGTGGLVACRALADGAPIDDLVLWGVRGRGRAAVREISAFGRMVADQNPADHVGTTPSGGIDVGGYLLSDTTVAALSIMNVGAMEFPEPGRRRALLLGRDELGIDGHLSGSLRLAGMTVEEVHVRDYAALLAHAQSKDTRRPVATIALTSRWLAQGTHSASERTDLAAALHDTPASHSVEIPWGDGRVREHIYNLNLAGASATAVVATPDAGALAAPTAVVLLNSGPLRKTGPQRMWIELSRRWAASGISCVRADFGAVGDSAGDDLSVDEGHLVTILELTSERMVDTTVELLATLRERGIAERFILVGHCSGAYIGCAVALRDAGVTAVFTVNQGAFVYSPETYQELLYQRTMTAARAGVLQRLRERGVTRAELRQAMRAVRHRLGAGRRAALMAAEAQREGKLLDQLRDREVRLVMLFSQDGELYDHVFAPGFQNEMRDGRWPNSEIEALPTKDHMARAIWLQKLIQQRLETALEDVLAPSKV